MPLTTLTAAMPVAIGMLALSQGIPSDKKAIESLIRQYVQAGDDRNESMLETLLHPDHRVILSHFRGNTGTAIMSRSTYLEMIKAGKLGGEKRTVTILSVDVLPFTATARVTLDTDKARFQSIYLLVKTDDSWQLITDMPMLETK